MILRREQFRIGLLAIVFLSILVFASDRRDQRFSGAISLSRCAGCAKLTRNPDQSYVLPSRERARTWLLSDQVATARYALQRVAIWVTASADRNRIGAAAKVAER